MKRMNIALLAKRTLCFLLMLVLTAGCLPLSAHAAVLSGDKILDALDFSDTRIYDETCFHNSAEELVLLIADALEGIGDNRDIIYDDVLSTKETEKYILMGGSGRPAMYVHCSMTSSRKVWLVKIGTKHEDMNDSQFADALYALAVAYGALNGNMNGRDWEIFATEQNLARVEEADNAYVLNGIFYGLYYRIAVDDLDMNMLVSPEGNVNSMSVAKVFPEGKAFLTEKDFTITADAIRQDNYGNITVDITLKNTGRKALNFHLDHSSVYDVSSNLTVYATVSPGKERRTSLYLSAAFLAGSELDYLDDLRLVFVVTDAASGDSVYAGATFLPLGIPLGLDYQKYNRKLFENEDFTLNVIGSYRDSETDTPKILLRMTNNVYGEVRLESESSICTIGNAEFDMYTNLMVGRYSDGVVVLSPMNYDHEGKATLSFDLQISTRNYNPLVSGAVTVTLDQNGKITGVTTKMKELPGYDKTLDAEY